MYSSLLHRLEIEWICGCLQQLIGEGAGKETQQSLYNKRVSETLVQCIYIYVSAEETQLSRYILFFWKVSLLLRFLIVSFVWMLFYVTEMDIINSLKKIFFFVFTRRKKIKRLSCPLLDFKQLQKLNTDLVSYKRFSTFLKWIEKICFDIDRSFTIITVNIKCVIVNMQTVQ